MNVSHALLVDCLPTCVPFEAKFSPTSQEEIPWDNMLGLIELSPNHIIYCMQSVAVTIINKKCVFLLFLAALLLYQHLSASCRTTPPPQNLKIAKRSEDSCHKRSMHSL